MLFHLPFSELVCRSASLHRQHFDPTKVQNSNLLPIKTGGGAEDCAYHLKSARSHTGVNAEKMM